MPSLIIQSGKHRGKKLVLPAGEVVVGRDEECRIRLASNDVSRRHCKMRIGADGFFVTDLGSSNGTFVNNIPVTKELGLANGDLLRIGPVDFRVADVERPVAEEETHAANLTTDDDISKWLSPENSAPEPESGETTILKDRPRSEKPEDATPVESPLPEVPDQAPRKRFASLAEEAADVIRRYKDKLTRGRSDDDPSTSQR